jgi:hypothetical protein
VDNRAYYRLVDGDPQHYFDATATGNSFNVRHRESLRLIMDSLRYWVTEMHVDGFRFDLASALAWEFHAVDRLAPSGPLMRVSASRRSSGIGSAAVSSCPAVRIWMVRSAGWSAHHGPTVSPGWSWSRTSISGPDE